MIIDNITTKFGDISFFLKQFLIRWCRQTLTRLNLSRLNSDWFNAFGLPSSRSTFDDDLSLQSLIASGNKLWSLTKWKWFWWPSYFWWVNLCSISFYLFKYYYLKFTIIKFINLYSVEKVQLLGCQTQSAAGRSR